MSTAKATISNTKIFFLFLLVIIVPLALYFLFSSLVPFIISYILAYLIIPAVNFLNKKLPFLSFNTSVIIVYSVFCLMFIVSILTVIPIIFQQLVAFIERIIAFTSTFNSEEIQVKNILENLNLNLGIDNISDYLNKVMQNFFKEIFIIASNIINSLWGYTLATINFIVTIVMVPFLLFYFLYDWYSIKSKFQDLIPYKYKTSYLKYLKTFNFIMSSYIRGQCIIIFSMSCYYALFFSLIKLDLFLLFSLIAGFFSILPFIGGIFSFTLIMINAYFYYGFEIELLYLCGIFALGGILEGWFLTPKVLGTTVGLHPVLVIFGIILGGNIYGIIGMILSVPIMSLSRVFFKYILKKYVKSKFYTAN